MKYVISMCLLFVSLAFPDFKRTSGLVDIPTARIMPHLAYRIGADLTIELGPGEYQHVVEENLHFSLGLGDFAETYFDVYTIVENWTVAFGFAHRFFDYGRFGLAWGIHTLAAHEDISEIAHGDSTGWHDDLMYEQADYDKPCLQVLSR